VVCSKVERKGTGMKSLKGEMRRDEEGRRGGEDEKEVVRMRERW